VNKEFFFGERKVTFTLEHPAPERAILSMAADVEPFHDGDADHDTLEIVATFTDTTKPGDAHRASAELFDAWGVQQAEWMAQLAESIDLLPNPAAKRDATNYIHGMAVGILEG
jgi:hypothetical protein